MERETKVLAWLGSSLEDVRAFPADARRDIGRELLRVQHGLLPTDWKPMAQVGQGACEIRVHGTLEARAIFVAKFAEAIYVLHAFEKKTRKTRTTDIDLARKRFAELVRLRKDR